MVDLPSDLIEAAAAPIHADLGCTVTYAEHLARAALTAAAPMIAEMCAQAAEDSWNGRSNTKATIQSVAYSIRALFPPRGET